jgi:hypothetical protein
VLHAAFDVAKQEDGERDHDQHQDHGLAEEPARSKLRFGRPP